MLYFIWSPRKPFSSLPYLGPYPVSVPLVPSIHDGLGSFCLFFFQFCFIAHVLLPICPWPSYDLLLFEDHEANKIFSTRRRRGSTPADVVFFIEKILLRPFLCLVVLQRRQIFFLFNQDNQVILLRSSLSYVEFVTFRLCQLSLRIPPSTMTDDDEHGFSSTICFVPLSCYSFPAILLSTEFDEGRGRFCLYFHYLIGAVQMKVQLEFGARLESLLVIRNVSLPCFLASQGI